MPSTNIEAADMLWRVGSALYPDDADFHIRLARRLNVKVGTTKAWLSGKTKSLTRAHSVFAELEELLLQREQELQQVRAALQQWREGNEGRQQA